MQLDYNSFEILPGTHVPEKMKHLFRYATRPQTPLTGPKEPLSERPASPFTNPLVECKYGKNCLRNNCYYRHHEIRPLTIPFEEAPAETHLVTTQYPSPSPSPRVSQFRAPPPGFITYPRFVFLPVDDSTGVITGLEHQKTQLSPTVEVSEFPPWIKVTYA